MQVAVPFGGSGKIVDELLEIEVLAVLEGLAVGRPGPGSCEIALTMGAKALMRTMSVE